MLVSKFRHSPVNMRLNLTLYLNLGLRQLWFYSITQIDRTLKNLLALLDEYKS